MKVCPQCNSVFGDDFVFCSNDGTVLVEENLLLPTEADDAETETIIRRAPIVVDFNEPLPTQAETVEMHHNDLPPALPAQPIIVEKTSRSKFYALFLLVGLLIGGGLVLATLLAARYMNRQSETNVSVQTKAVENKNQKTPQPVERDNEIDKLADELHSKRDASKTDEDFNGRVIVSNANVRAAPSASASQIDILPNGDRITIERRESASSPWFYVTCEHGISGWMHGNTIEYTQ